MPGTRVSDALDIMELSTYSAEIADWNVCEIHFQW